MKSRSIGLFVLLLMAAGAASAQGFKEMRGVMTGYQEVPAVSSTGGGSLRLRVFDDGSALSYELAYEQLEGTATQAHIHFGQRSVNGGVGLWLCSNLASPPTPAGTPACPPTAGMVSGVLTAADVVGPAAQGIAPGEFAEMLAAIRAGVAYVNVHTDKHPGGEIRGQVGVGMGGTTP